MQDFVTHEELFGILERVLDELTQGMDDTPFKGMSREKTRHELIQEMVRRAMAQRKPTSPTSDSAY